MDFPKTVYGKVVPLGGDPEGTIIFSSDLNDLANRGERPLRVGVYVLTEFAEVTTTIQIRPLRGSKNSA